VVTATGGFTFAFLLRIAKVFFELERYEANARLTGKIDPGAGPEIVDRKSCVVVVPEKFGGYARYYLTRFKMDDARIQVCAHFSAWEY
jgi:hypothetical protein